MFQLVSKAEQISSIQHFCMQEQVSSFFFFQITAELPRHNRHNYTVANGGGGDSKGYLIESQPLQSPLGSCFLSMEHAECSVFIGQNQILQMTWSPLQWRWSLLV